MNGSHAGTIAGKGGPCPPANWSDDPWFFSIAVQLFRLKHAYYVPHFGAVISRRNKVMRRSVAQAFYLGPKITEWPGWVEIEQRMRHISTLPELGKVIVTMPWGANGNYGHFTLDCLSGVAAARRISELADYRFVFPPR